MAKKIIGVIGGSGLYEIEGLKNVREERLHTPFGEPSDSYIIGDLGETELVFLPRHGRGHRLMPSEMNYRANIHGMKQLGVQWIIAVSAVGSMRETIAPGQLVVPDQFFDRTKARIPTFFGDGIVAHVAFADPVCSHLRKLLVKAGKKVDTTVHDGGIYICMEGPAFSTRAESHIYRSWGVDIIGMTNIPEAKLAREAEICYATLALVTDYDCWREPDEDVSIESILSIMKKNVVHAKKLIAEAVKLIEEPRDCKCANALEYAIITDHKLIPEDTKKRLDLLIGKYVE